MFHKAVKLFPDPVLRKKASTVKHFGDSVERIIKKLDSVMLFHGHSIGIAAPQIGISKRIAIVDVSERVPGAQKMILINPEILEVRDEKVSKEGCMSIPEYAAYLKRYNWIRFRWQDRKGNYHEKISIDIEAVCVQHEIDHLEGVLFVDRVCCLKSDMIPRQFRKPSR